MNEKVESSDDHDNKRNHQRLVIGDETETKWAWLYKGIQWPKIKNEREWKPIDIRINWSSNISNILFDRVYEN